MTRLTTLYVQRMRGVNPEPIPFPTLFFDLIYLQKFTSSYNNFSGFLNETIKLLLFMNLSICF